MNYSFIVPGVLVLFIIMGYYFFRPRLQIRLNRAFLAILIINIGLQLFECVASLLNETWQSHDPALLIIFNTLFYIFCLSSSYMFFVFTISVLDSNVLVSHPLRKYYPVVFFPCVALVLINPVTHWLFRVDNGYHPGPLSGITYFCAGCYLLFGTIGVLRHIRQLSVHGVISLLALQGILLAGNIARALLPQYIVIDTFCIMGIIVIFMSFLNPDLYLSDRGYAYNFTAFRALLDEYHRRHKPCRILGFAIQNYNEHREIFGGKQMDEALTQINKFMTESFPYLSAFYLRNGSFALVGSNYMDLTALRDRVRERFGRSWITGAGDLRLSVSFVEADTEILDCPSDRLVNTLMLSQDEISRVSEPDASCSLTDSIGEINRKLDIRRCLEKALDQDKLEVFLQPLMDCSTGKRVAAEALVRLRDDNGDLIRPDLFIGMAEQEGHIVRLGEQVLSHVCEFIRDNDMEKICIKWINVNLSPVQFMSRDIPSTFSEILQEYGVDESMIHLEITEQSMIDFSLLREQIIGLHENGFEFSLDDYGSGYSNLTRVRQYPFTNIKIDMEVVHNYCQDRDPLLPALVQGFKEMNLSITAEGIETREMAEILKGIGCDYLQGYYFSRPVPMSEFLVMDI